MAPPALNITSQVVLGFSSVLLALIGAAIIKKVLSKERIPKEWQKVGTVKELFIYPLKSGKSCGALSLYVTERGVKETDKNDGNIELRDRSFLIYTSKDREVRSARQIPKTVLISIQPAENGVILSAPNKIDLYIGLPTIKNDVKVTLTWGSTFGNEDFRCTDCGDSVAKWLSNFLLGKDEGLRLGFGDGSQARNVLRDHRKWAAHYTNMDNDMAGIFSDLAALHMVNQSTIDNLNEKLDEGQKISVRNFRPNILIEGLEAFEEDTFRHVKIGNVVTKVSLECLRCIETTVSQNGEMNKQREPLKTLESYRKSNGPFKYGVMGVYLRVLTTGKISCGDIVYIPK